MSDRLPGDKIYDDLLHPSFEAAGIIASLPIRALRVKLAPYEKWIVSAEKNIPLIAESVSENIAKISLHLKHILLSLPFKEFLIAWIMMN